ncbi:MAG: XRE family transcriptional regulator [Pirellulaceae bacterium]|nr:XRE family transcriptional regulator [Pirellulaceae bacterium]
MRTGTPSFRGDQLRAAREARSLTGAALADLANVTRSAISQYERGEQKPSPTVLQKLADALNLPGWYFCTEMKDISSPVFYRSFASALQRARLRAERRLEWLVEIVDFVSESVELPRVNVPEIAPHDDVLSLSDDDIEEFATKVRRTWGLGDGPLSSVVTLAENNGILVARQFLDSDKLDAFSYWPDQDACPIVVLSTDKECAVRSRFDLAHEIGHLFLHRHLKREQISSPKNFKTIERQANRFAGAFLLPSKTFLQELVSMSLDAFLALKGRWKTSVSLMLKRCEDLGAVNEDVATRLWMNLARRGWRKREPLDDSLPVEQPKFLPRSFELLLSTGPEARDHILARLPWRSDEIEALVGMESGLLGVTDKEQQLTPKIFRFPWTE